jgi:hypothetical protein
MISGRVVIARLGESVASIRSRRVRIGSTMTLGNSLDSPVSRKPLGESPQAAYLEGTCSQSQRQEDPFPGYTDETGAYHILL